MSSVRYIVIEFVFEFTVWINMGIIMKKAHSGFFGKLITLVLPIAFQQFMLALVTASDAVMLGSLSQDAMSAVSLASQITFVQNLFLAAMTIGLSMLAAQYWGKKDIVSVEKIFAYVMKVTSAISFVFFLVALCFPTFLMRIFTNEKDLITFGAEYLRTVSPAFFLTGISQIFLCTIKNTGRASLSSIIASSSVVINIVLNAVLIFGLFGFPKMEIVGAALATVVSRIVEVIWSFFETLRKDSLKLRLKFIIHNSKDLCGDFWKYTTPVLCNEIVWGIGFTMYSVIMGHLGSDAVAANSVANIVKNLVACFSLGIASGGGIMVGNELGAGHLDVAKKYGRKLCLFAVASGCISGAVLLALSPFILHIVGLNEVATEYLKGMIFICSYNLIGYAVTSTTITGIFCSGGDTKFGLRCDAVVMWGITVPLGIVSAFVLKLPVVWVFFIVNLDELLKVPAAYIHYKKYLWVKNLTSNENKE